MDANVLIGSWVNQYGSTMTITDISESDSSFKGTYYSTTGETGTYNITGCFNPVIDKDIASLTTVIAVSWNNIAEGATNTSEWDKSVSSMAGQVQKVGDKYILAVSVILVVPTLLGNNWKSSYIENLTFRKQ